MPYLQPNNAVPADPGSDTALTVIVPLRSASPFLLYSHQSRNHVLHHYSDRFGKLQQIGVY